MPGPDRVQLLLAQDRVTGLDFIYVHPDQVTLDVYFLRSPATLATPLVNDLALERVRIYSPSGGERLPEVRVTGLAWAVVDGRDVVRLTTATPGDFSLYRLQVDDARVDPYLNDIAFSFKANCPSDLDCAPPGPECPPEAEVDFPVDYRARDFWSFRRALLDFAAQRYPDWLDRLEADGGVMLAEVLSAVGDELAYYQDRIGREAYLETASQRRSLRRHARLVDYTVHDGLGATAWIDVEAAAGQAGVVPAGTDLWATSDEGGQINYEVGRDLREILDGKTYPVDAARNSLLPHLWDEDDACLKVAATELFIKGRHKATLPLDDAPPGRQPGRWVLLRTDPVDPSRPARHWLVRLVEVTELEDPLANDPLTGRNITRLRWEPAQALPFEMDLAVLRVRGNILPAIAGRTYTQRFAIGPSPDPESVAEAVERQGPEGSTAYLFSLAGSDASGLVWLGEAPQRARPQVDLVELAFSGGAWVRDEPWEWRRSLLGTNSSLAGDRHFTLDDGLWQRVVGFQRIGQEIVHRDYASGVGSTLRFGDGEFGLVPPAGTVFEVTYRLGNGRQANVAADSITGIQAGLAFVQAVSNPLPAENGLDPEPAEQVRQLAPEAFRYVTFRAVRPEDYAEAAERLAWVQRAGATFRWTGSWLSAFVTPDPRGAVAVSAEQRRELVGQLDRFRQAGREAYTLEPVYANLDLEIEVCVEPFAYAGEVKERVREALVGRKGVRARPGFFAPDNFTFGTTLHRSALEAAIQAVPGVRAVEAMRIRRRGWFAWRPFIELVFDVGADEVIRLQDDPLFPERGSLRLAMRGGA